MAVLEKQAWIMLVVTVIAAATYATIVIGLVAAWPLAAVDYAPAMLWTIGAGILGTILGNSVVGIRAGKEARLRDVRDREIERFGDRVGNAFLVIAALAALILSLLDAERFWIANSIYLGFVLSAVLSSVARVVAYRRGFQEW